MAKYNSLYDKILDICSDEVGEQQKAITDINLYLSKYLYQNDLKFLVESLINMGVRHRLIAVGYLDDIESSLDDVGGEYESAFERHVNSGQYDDLLLYKVITKNISYIDDCFVVITSAYLCSHEAINELDLHDVSPEIKNFVGNLFSGLPGQLASQSVANEGADCDIDSELSSDCELPNNQSNDDWGSCTMISSHSIYRCKIETSIKYVDPKYSIATNLLILHMQLDVLFFKNTKRLQFWSHFIDELCVKYGIDTPSVNRSDEISTQIRSRISRANRGINKVKPERSELLFAIAPIPRNSKDFDKKELSLYKSRLGNTLFAENRENLYRSVQDNFNADQQSCAQKEGLEQEFQIEHYGLTGANVTYIKEFGIILVMSFFGTYKDCTQVSAAYTSEALPLSVAVDQHNSELQSQSNCCNNPESVAQSLTDEYIAKLINDYDVEVNNQDLLEGYAYLNECPMNTLMHTNNVSAVDGQQMDHGTYKDCTQVSAAYNSKALPLSAAVDQHNSELQSQSNCCNNPESVAQSLTDEYIAKLINDYDVEVNNQDLLEGYAYLNECPMNTLMHANNVSAVDGQQMDHSIA